MAGAGYKLFNTGDVLTAAQVNTYLQEQVVMRFATTAARTTALSSVLAEGMVSYIDATDTLEFYNGSAWVAVNTTAGDITGITTGATSGLTGGVTSGTADLKLNTTAKGGLLVGTGSGTVTELAVGTNAHVLTADSTTASGLKWAAASAGKNINYNFNTSTTNYNTTSSTFTALDTTNYRVTATTTGTFAIGILNAYQLTSGTGDRQGWWRLNCGSGTSRPCIVTDPNYTVQGRYMSCTAVVIITGLTANTQYNFDWEWRVSVNGTFTIAQDLTENVAKMVVIC